MKSILEQTSYQSKIIIVNNNLNDSMKEVYKDNNKIVVLEYENIGGAGGFHMGLRYVYEERYDWYFLIDDDVIFNQDALEKLLDQAEKKIKSLDFFTVHYFLKMEFWQI